MIVEKDGTYEFTLCRWAPEPDTALNAPLAGAMGKGRAVLETWFYDEGGKAPCSAYYAQVGAGNAFIVAGPLARSSRTPGGFASGEQDMWSMSRVVRGLLFAVVVFSASARSSHAESQADEYITISGVRGGLVVHVGCGDGKLTAALRKGDAYVVHGLDVDAAHVQDARRHILGGKHAGRVSAAVFDGRHLPYVDNMVNLVVCSRTCDLPEREILRVLCPGGVALIPEADKLRRITKPRPDSHDEWTHYLHGADNNAVSKDTAVAAPIEHLQWNGSPRYGVHHDKSSSFPATVSAGGRVYYIADEGPRASVLWGAKWRLVARDAFNGVVLWRQKIDRWTSRLWPLKSGPSTSPRRLVAVGNSVYVTLGVLAPVTKLDGVTGEKLTVYAGTERAEEIVFRDDVLYLVINPGIDPNQRGGIWARRCKKVMAVRETGGQVLWQKEYPWIAPCTLAVTAGRVYLSDGPHILALDPRTGREIWKSRPLPQRDKTPTYFAPTLVAVAGGVLYAGGEQWREHAGSRGLMTFLDAETGEVKWQRPHLPSGYQSPQDIFVIGGKAWCGSLNSKPGEFDRRYPDVSPSTGEFVSYDIASGKPAGSIPRGADNYWFHHRCHRAKATERFFLTSRTGIEMIDVRTGKWSLHHWVRGACLYGLMPANGLIYAPPHPCACYPEAILTGFNAVSGPRPVAAAETLKSRPRLLKGPAFDEAARSGPPKAAPDDWPTFRGNMARDGSTKRAVGTNLTTKWQAGVGGRLSQPVVAGGKVFVGAIDDHAVVALDRASGKIAWTYIAGGRVDSPPTLHGRLALFGCADGYVYCLRASDGVLAWRFRAAPLDRRIMVREQLESVWPVHGSVLVREGVAYVVAGRSMFLDGGLTLYRLNARTGEVLSSVPMDDSDPGTGKNLHSHIRVLSMPVASPDILSCDGDTVYMRSQPMTPDGKRHRVAQLELDKQRGDDAHLFAPKGFLDDEWWHRSFWVYGRAVLGGPGYSATGKSAPAGKIMVLDDKKVYVFGRRMEYWRWTTPMEFRLFAVDRALPLPKKPAPAKDGRRKGRRRASGQKYAEIWSIELPILARAMVKTGDTIFAAGPADVVDERKAAALAAKSETISPELRRQERLFAGDGGSVLWAVSGKDGAKLGETKLDVAPVFDGLTAAGGALYMATVDGKVVCLGAPARQP